jgi:hypothetical protein
VLNLSKRVTATSRQSYPLFFFVSNVTLQVCPTSIYSCRCSSINFFPNLPTHFSVPKMSTLGTIGLLVKEISSLSNSLADSVPKGSKDDKIWSVMNSEERDTPHETFNRRFDALFAEDCRDAEARLHYVRQGKLGMGLVVSYLSRINWTLGFPLDLVELKLQRLVTELKHLQYALFHSVLSVLINYQASGCSPTSTPSQPCCKAEGPCQHLST